jgi:crotonobetainyl-CoA:carnitine CoA-transferase CaiB-like acyl-CoA transferase
MADSSALGTWGPWSERMGYGPLVRASAGLTSLWRYPDTEAGFSDASTIYPDHVVGRVGAAVVVAQLIRLRHTGQGGTVSISQAEIILSALADLYLAESLHPGTLVAPGGSRSTDAPQGVFRCAGDDEWCAVQVRDDADWQRLCTAIDRPALAADPRLADARGRLAHREEVEAAITCWAGGHDPRKAMELLQHAGVPAGAMLRVVDLLDDPQLAARGFFAELRQPSLNETLPTEARPAITRGLADPPLRPAPLQAQHTRELCREWLGMEEPEIDALVAAGVLEEAEHKA